MTDEYPAAEDRPHHPYEGGYENYGTPYQGVYDGAYQPGEGDTQGAGFAPGEGVWQPLTHSGEFDAEATMSTQFAGNFDFQSLATGGQPLAAPGHGYVPQPHVPQHAPAPHDPYATATPPQGTQWHPAAEHVPPQAEEQAAAEQWSVPFAPEDPAEESGEYSVGAVVTPPLDPPAPQAAHYPAETYTSPYGPETYHLPEHPQEFAPAEPPAQAWAGPAAPQDFASDPLNAPLPEFAPQEFRAPEYPAPEAEYAPEAVEAPDAFEAPEAVEEPEAAAEEPEAPAEEPAEPVAAEDLAPEPDPVVDPDPDPDPEPVSVALPEAGQDADADPDPDADPDDPHSEHPTASYVLTVNGTEKPVTGAWLGESLLYVLRERLGLAGAKDGCEQGECGACSVQVDGRLVASCLVPAATAAGSEVRTVEGLAEDGRPSDVQRALAACGAVQCGFCVPGMAMTVHDLLEGNHRPTELQTRAALAGNLCRCSGYRGVLAAVDQVAAEREAAHEAEREAERLAGHEVHHDPYAAGHDLFGGDATARIPHQATGEPDGASS